MAYVLLELSVCYRCKSLVWRHLPYPPGFGILTPCAPPTACPVRSPTPALHQLQDNGVTLEIIAQELGVTHERVRQIETAALVKCRRWANRHGYRLGDLLGV